MSESQPDLKKCPECANAVPAEARKCAHCGHKFVHRSNIAAPIILVLAVALVSMALFGESAPQVVMGVFYVGAAIIIIRLILNSRKPKGDAESTTE